jgi:hypothetical protein
MAAMTTVLKEFTNSGNNSRTSTLVGHTAVKPKILIEKRKVATNDASMVEQSFKIVHATEDADGVVLTQKVSFEGIMRYPVLGQSTDVDAVLTTGADVISGDEWANSVDTQEWLS